MSDAARRRWNSSRDPSPWRRSRMVDRNGPEAPAVLAEPTSSWSNSAITATSAVGAAAARAVVAAQHDTRLSRRPLASMDRVRAEDAGRLDVVEAELPPRRCPVERGHAAQPLLEVERQVGRPHGRQMGLAVEHEAALVDVTVEMDGELRNACDRRVDVHEGRFAVRRQHPPGHSEVAVEPAVQEHTAVHLDAELAPARPRSCRDSA